MGFDDRATEDLVGADATVVAALRGWEAVVWPAEGLDPVEERVLLLQTEPGVVVLIPLAYYPTRRAGSRMSMAGRLHPRPIGSVGARSGGCPTDWSDRARRSRR